MWIEISLQCLLRSVQSLNLYILHTDIRCSIAILNIETFKKEEIVSFIFFPPSYQKMIVCKEKGNKFKICFHVFPFSFLKQPKKSTNEPNVPRWCILHSTRTRLSLYHHSPYPLLPTVVSVWYFLLPRGFSASNFKPFFFFGCLFLH